MKRENVKFKIKKLKENILIIQMNVINLVQRSIFPLGLICLDHDFSLLYTFFFRIYREFYHWLKFFYLYETVVVVTQGVLSKHINLLNIGPYIKWDMYCLSEKWNKIKKKGISILYFILLLLLLCAYVALYRTQWKVMSR